MQLISALQEAADLPVEQVIPAMKKDKRINAVFRKIAPDDIDNVRQFVDTLKYYFFNNQNVIEYHRQKGSGGSKFINENSFKYWRKKLNAGFEGFDKWDLEQLRNTINALGKELDKDVEPKATSGLAKVLSTWADSGHRGYTMQDYIAKELFTFPTLRPKKPVVLYRGLMFDDKSLREEPDYSGKMTVGSGLKFLRSVREGTRVVDLEWDRYSTWTHDIDIAIRHAHAGSEVHSTEKGKMHWRGKLGFVVSALIPPGDIVIDTELAPPEYKYLPADTVVVVAGKRTCRLVKRFTPAGEEDVLKKDTDLEGELEDMYDSLTLLNAIIKPPYPEPEHARIGQGVVPIEEFKKLIDPSAADKINRVIDQVHGVFNDQLADYDVSKLQTIAAGTAGKVAPVLAALIKKLTDTVTTKIAPGRYGKGESAPRNTVPASEQFKFNGYSDAANLKHIGASTKRFTSWGTGGPLIHLSHILGVPVLKDAHLSGFAAQRAWTERILEAYRQLVHDLPKDVKQATAIVANDMDTYNKNAKALEYLYSIKQLLSNLEG